jgi:hypothetical protein
LGAAGSGVLPPPPPQALIANATKTVMDSFWMNLDAKFKFILSSVFISVKRIIFKRSMVKDFLLTHSIWQLKHAKVYG